jgi:thioredoxin 1
MEYPTANLTLQEFNKIIESDQPTFVDFYATWCEPCKYLDEILTELEPRISSISKIIKLDVDEQILLSQEFGIKSVPTIMIFKNGELMWRMAGFMLVHELEEKVKSFVF